MKLYVYKIKNNKVVAIITGTSNDACERIAGERYGDTDYWGWTYSPGEELIEAHDAERIAA